MKRIIAALAVVLLLVSAVGCGQSAQVAETVKGNMQTYSVLSDGTYRCGDITYQYRLEITGRMPNAAKDSTFTYLSNLPDITFERAWKAAGLSSNMNDYFDPKDAVLVNME